MEEIVAVTRAAGDGPRGRRLRGLIVVLWRAGLRIDEALAPSESDLDRRRGSLLVRRGKGGRRREVAMDEGAWEQLEPWSAARLELPPPRALTSAASQRPPGCADALPRISSVTRTRSRRPGK